MSAYNTSLLRRSNSSANRRSYLTMSASPGSEAELVDSKGQGQHVAMDSTASTPDEDPAIQQFQQVTSVSEGGLSPHEASSLKPDSNGHEPSGGDDTSMVIINSKDPLIMVCPRCGAVWFNLLSIQIMNKTPPHKCMFSLISQPGCSHHSDCGRD